VPIETMLAQILSLRFARNYLSTMGFLLAGWYICFYLSGFHRGMLNAVLAIHIPNVDITIHSPDLFIALLIIYALVLIPYYALHPWLSSKTWIFLRGLWLGIRRDATPLPKARTGKKAKKTSAPIIRNKPKISAVTSQAGLALLLKFFFAPLMINWCLGHISDMSNNLSVVRMDLYNGVWGRGLFDHALFWAAFQLILFVDTLLFTLGYIIEIPSLNNRIISVEPSFLGWFVCLACYPPFNGHTSSFFQWQSTDFPHFENDILHFTLNCGILVLMGIYSWASVALGLKASNLTNRGIVAEGPYAFVRHPAYTTKNLAWWIGALPAFYIAFGNSISTGLFSVMCTAGWSFIYCMRALTEERHLLRANNGYAEYMQKVRWRFIPGIY
jgi:protein-S-isoprenylcysteine O-methyltransferase Ste14